VIATRQGSCQNLESTHTVIFGGFSRNKKDRLIDAPPMLTLMYGWAAMRLYPPSSKTCLIGNGSAKRPSCPAHGTATLWSWDAIAGGMRAAR